MSIASEIQRLQADSAAIAAAITAKDVTVPSGSGFDDYASLIRQISTGGGSGGGSGGDVVDYVQNGLVLHLDGKYKGGTSGRWGSLAGSEYYTLTSHSTSETNAILMDGSGEITSTNTVSVDSASGTIEVCAQYLGTGSSIIIYGGDGKLCFCIGSTGYAFGNGSTNNLWQVTKQDLFTCSMNSSRCVLNGIATGTKGSTTWSSALNVNCIGGRTNMYSNQYFSNVRIYSIRKYNRILTEAEMKQNQSVDNVRFNLGLNI